MAFFSVKDLQVYYGAIHAIKGISFEDPQGRNRHPDRRKRRRKDDDDACHFRAFEAEERRDCL